MKLFVFINNSKGELDWIAPFLSDRILHNDNIDIYLHNIEEDESKLKHIIKDYNLNKDNINIIKFNNKIFKLFKLYDSIFERILARFKETNSILYNFFNWIYISSLKFILFFKFSKKTYDFIFRDYNLKETTILFNIINSNPQAKIVVFPHAFGIQRLPSWAKSKISHKKVKCDLYLENTYLSTRFLDIYRNCFFVSGAPIIALNYNKESLFSLSSNNVLILLRDGYESSGCTNEQALNTFKKVLSFLNKNEHNVFVKRHPRKNVFQEQFSNEINRYDNVQIYNDSLISLNQKFIFCLSFFSSGGLFLTSRHIPVFDITEYKKCNDPTVYGLATHFCNKGKLTHYLLHYGMQNSLNDLNKLLDKDYLKIISETQYNNLKKYYPADSNIKIYNKLKELYGI
jgi:hypothetical protein